MDRVEIEKKLADLENQIKKSYKNGSILERVCTLKEVSNDEEHGTFKQFAGRFLIERSHVTDPSHVLLLGELGLSVARSEIELLIEEISKQEKSTIDDFSIEKIREKVNLMKGQGYKPNMVFIPIEYFHDVYDWNKTHKEIGSEGSAFDTLQLDASTSLRVNYSNKKIEFEDVIIISNEVNIWKYRPDLETNERLIAKFNWDEGDETNVILGVKTIYKFLITDRMGNVVLKINNFKKRD